MPNMSYPEDKTCRANRSHVILGPMVKSITGSNSKKKQK